ncbi:hypothetical protein HXX76_009375 [Chlamydomonas incerta]|uniref:Uncharacterized protein n=1 Tax=Chlamydomonas incerta TaxID=51695 RepID=A0A835SUQ3_CHLIN|nr:hypothetical protein HXX76_009375 [Chlamydomonas incerta]|eukprot:KAG2431882.1 hypothetical protein HXX76_009375 [Chlamydomonas incerta]
MPLYCASNVYDCGNYTTAFGAGLPTVTNMMGGGTTTACAGDLSGPPVMGFCANGPPKSPGDVSSLCFTKSNFNATIQMNFQACASVADMITTALQTAIASKGISTYTGFALQTCSDSNMSICASFFSASEAQRLQPDVDALLVKLRNLAAGSCSAENYGYTLGLYITSEGAAGTALTGTVNHREVTISGSEITNATELKSLFPQATSVQPVAVVLGVPIVLAFGEPTSGDSASQQITCDSPFVAQLESAFASLAGLGSGAAVNGTSCTQLVLAAAVPSPSASAVPASSPELLLPSPSPTVSGAAHRRQRALQASSSGSSTTATSSGTGSSSTSSCGSSSASSSVSLAVSLSVPVDAGSSSSSSSSRATTYDSVQSWQSGNTPSVIPSGVSVCGMSAVDQISVATQVRATYEVPLSSLGAEVLSTACSGSGAASGANAASLGLSGTDCQVSPASPSTSVRSSEDGTPTPTAAAAAPAGGSSSSGVPTVLIAAIAAGGVAAAVSLGIAGVVIRRRRRLRVARLEEERARQAEEMLRDNSFISLEGNASVAPARLDRALRPSRSRRGLGGASSGGAAPGSAAGSAGAVGLHPPQQLRAGASRGGALRRLATADRSYHSDDGAGAAAADGGPAAGYTSCRYTRVSLGQQDAGGAASEGEYQARSGGGGVAGMLGGRSQRVVRFGDGLDSPVTSAAATAAGLAGGATRTSLMSRMRDGGASAGGASRRASGALGDGHSQSGDARSGGGGASSHGQSRRHSHGGGLSSTHSVRFRADDDDGDEESGGGGLYASGAITTLGRASIATTLGADRATAGSRAWLTSDERGDGGGEYSDYAADSAAAAAGGACGTDGGDTSLRGGGAARNSAPQARVARLQHYMSLVDGGTGAGSAGHGHSGPISRRQWHPNASGAGAVGSGAGGATNSPRHNFDTLALALASTGGVRRNTRGSRLLNYRNIGGAAAAANATARRRAAAPNASEDEELVEEDAAAQWVDVQQATVLTEAQLARVTAWQQAAEAAVLAEGPPSPPSPVHSCASSECAPVWPVRQQLLLRMQQQQERQRGERGGRDSSAAPSAPLSAAASASAFAAPPATGRGDLSFLSPPSIQVLPPPPSAYLQPRAPAGAGSGGASPAFSAAAAARGAAAAAAAAAATAAAAEPSAAPSRPYEHSDLVPLKRIRTATDVPELEQGGEAGEPGVGGCDDATLEAAYASAGAGIVADDSAEELLTLQLQRPTTTAQPETPVAAMAAAAGAAAPHPVQSPSLLRRLTAAAAPLVIPASASGRLRVSVTPGSGSPAGGGAAGTLGGGSHLSGLRSSLVTPQPHSPGSSAHHPFRASTNGTAGGGGGGGVPLTDVLGRRPWMSPRVRPFTDTGVPPHPNSGAAPGPGGVGSVSDTNAALTVAAAAAAVAAAAERGAATVGGDGVVLHTGGAVGGVSHRPVLYSEPNGPPPTSQDYNGLTRMGSHGSTASTTTTGMVRRTGSRMAWDRSNAGGAAAAAAAGAADAASASAPVTGAIATGGDLVAADADGEYASGAGSASMNMMPPQVVGFAAVGRGSVGGLGVRSLAVVSPARSAAISASGKSPSQPLLKLGPAATAGSKGSSNSAGDAASASPRRLDTRLPPPSLPAYLPSAAQQRPRLQTVSMPDADAGALDSRLAREAPSEAVMDMDVDEVGEEDAFYHGRSAAAAAAADGDDSVPGEVHAGVSLLPQPWRFSRGSNRGASSMSMSSNGGIANGIVRGGSRGTDASDVIPVGRPGRLPPPRMSLPAATAPPMQLQQRVLGAAAAAAGAAGDNGSRSAVASPGGLSAVMPGGGSGGDSAARRPPALGWAVEDFEMGLEEEEEAASSRAGSAGADAPAMLNGPNARRQTQPQALAQAQARRGGSPPSRLASSSSATDAQVARGAL